MVQPIEILGPLFTSTRFKDVKDPCVVFDGTLWHIYGSGGDVRTEAWHILHATSISAKGPWSEVDPPELHGVKGDHVAAPSVYFDREDQRFHMIVQTEFASIGGTIEYLESKDGHVFTRINTALESIPHSSEAGIYDAHQLVVENEKYLVYAGTPAIEGFNATYIIQPDVHLAHCEYDGTTQSSWVGPWRRRGIILDHDHISWHHNPRHHKEYEWGIEGPQLIILPDGRYLLNATCFLAEGGFGTRQRIFFAIADSITGLYRSFGPVIDPALYPDQEWLSGENGHATVIIEGDELLLFFQARSRVHPMASENNWRYGIAVFSVAAVVALEP